MPTAPATLHSLACPQRSRLPQIAVRVSKKCANPAAAISFLNELIAKLLEDKSFKSEQPVVLVKMSIAELHLFTGDLQESKALIDQGSDFVESRQDLEPVVYAAVYHAAAQLYKVKADFAAFYRAALKFLAYSDLGAMDPALQASMAVDISLAALLGEGVYSFGELVLHPVMGVLDGTPFAWLREFLQCFDGGDLHSYDDLCRKYSQQLSAQPALVKAEAELRKKARRGWGLGPCGGAGPHRCT